MLKVTPEPDGLEGMEHCCLCRVPTRFWYKPKDVALCVDCAKTATVAKLPSKSAWCTAERYLRYYNVRGIING